ncbi:unnamed protein product [Somion occarium]|uniref:Uncharacterized protein n=1 Tax=Somion occarium TaxID=3059160 RepID=A0ABP1CTZ6_9APHY
MIAIQKPVNALFSTPQAYRPTHGRHPSAPVVVRPTHTPGLLSLSKPANVASSRPQLAQAQPRAHKSSTPKKANRPPQAPQATLSVQESKKSSAPKSDKTQITSASPERSARGRQNKPAPIDNKADKRSTSNSPRARRQCHQPSPPPPASIPQQIDTTARPCNPLRAQSLNQRQSDSNSFDPFVVSSPSGKQSPDSPVAKSLKPITFRTPPELSRPSGKLARRRQSGQVNTSPTPSKAVPVSRIREKVASLPQLARSEPATTASTPRRGGSRSVSTGPALTVNWDSFPICDDSDDVTPPSTPIRESASVPPKRTGATWQQQSLIFDDGPRTAPLSAAPGYPFADRASLNATPTPSQRRRTHRRVPSEGMFAMSTDEDSSSSDASAELKSLVGLIPKRRAQAASTRRTPSPSTPDANALPAGFYAGSVFQNSPSPEELPVPAFMA